VDRGLVVVPEGPSHAGTGRSEPTSVFRLERAGCTPSESAILSLLFRTDGDDRTDGGFDTPQTVTGADRVDNTTDVGCHVAALVVSPYTRPGTVSSELFNHYSLFKTSEELLGLPLIGNATDPQIKSMASDFNL
jgi:hypothetical protein